LSNNHSRPITATITAINTDHDIDAGWFVLATACVGSADLSDGEGVVGPLLLVVGDCFLLVALTSAIGWSGWTPCNEDHFKYSSLAFPESTFSIKATL
jgi:hypothetical protein